MLAGGAGVQAAGLLGPVLWWKLLSYSQCQEFGQRANLASDWLPENKGPIRSQVSSLTKLLTLTTTQKFPPQDLPSVQQTQHIAKPIIT